MVRSYRLVNKIKGEECVVVPSQSEDLWHHERASVSFSGTYKSSRIFVCVISLGYIRVVEWSIARVFSLGRPASYNIKARNDTFQTVNMMWLLAVTLACASLGVNADLEVLHEWKYVEYAWPSSNMKANFTRNGQYNISNIIMNDLQPLSDGSILVTTPKNDYDNPASLSMVSDQVGDGGNILIPYPNWYWHTSSNCDRRLVSVARVRVDSKNRLWVVDSGKIGDNVVCSAKIVAFDLSTNEAVKLVTIPDEVAVSSTDSSKGRLELQVIREIEDEEYPQVFMADPEGYGVVIWDGSKPFRIEDDIFVPDQPEFQIDGETFQLEIGPSSFALIPDGFVAEPYILLKAGSSSNAYSMKISDMMAGKSGGTVTTYKTNFTAPSQELARDYSKDGILIAGFATEFVACWNLQIPLALSNIAILSTLDGQLEYISGTKIVTLTSGTEIVNVLSNSIQRYILNKWDTTRVNFRILGTDVASYVAGTVCEPTSHEIVPSIEDKNFLYYKN